MAELYVVIGALEEEENRMAKKQSELPPIEPREFRSVEEIDQGITKLRRRIQELEGLDIPVAIAHDNGTIKVAESNIGVSILEVFGANSPEFREYGDISIWSGGMSIGMQAGEIIEARTHGRVRVMGILNGLIARLNEKHEELDKGGAPAPASYFDKLNLHPRIRDVSRDQFLDGYHWEAVFAASKALVNYIKEKSGRHDLDGTDLARTVFSKNKPILTFNSLSNQTDLDEQEGMMHLFEGAILGIRNLGGHSFPGGPEQRAVEYISFLSLLAYRVQEAKRHTAP